MDKEMLYVKTTLNKFASTKFDESL